MIYPVAQNIKYDRKSRVELPLAKINLLNEDIKS